MAPASPRVSAIIPTFNRAALLKRSSAGVLAQTFGDLELIVVDDCSSDGRRDVVESFQDLRDGSVRKGSGLVERVGRRAAPSEFKFCGR